MRSDDEDDEEDYYDDHEEDDDGVSGSGINGAEEEDGDEQEDGSVEEGSDDDDGDAEDDEDGDGDGDGDEDEDEDNDIDVDADEDEDEDNDDEDDDEEERSDEDEGDGEGEGEGEAEGEEADVDMTVDGDGVGEGDDTGSLQPSQKSNIDKATDLTRPDPPHLVRRSLFTPAYSSSPSSLSIEAIVGIPVPSPVHSLASTACLSYLLAGSQDGYVRAYDLWASVNGGQMLSAQQRSVVGLGESVAKSGVARGWWANDVPVYGQANGNIVNGTGNGTANTKAEPVYSMACESDGLWALTGTRSGAINLSTLRHSPGHIVHSLKGHTNVVSCMALLPSEKEFFSGSWDGTVREWDLNTGQTIRTYPTHGAQLSSISLRPYGAPPSPSPSPRDTRDGEDDGDIDGKTHVSISMNPDFFDKQNKKDKTDSNVDEIQENILTESAAKSPESNENEDVEMGDGAAIVADGTKSPVAPVATDNASTPASNDSLFGGDDDEDDEDVKKANGPLNNNPTTSGIPLPSIASPQTKPVSLGLALPGQVKSAPPLPPQAVTSASGLTTPIQATPSSSSAPLFTPQTSTAGAGPSRLAGSGLAANIPLLSSASYRSFSEDVLLTSSMDGQVVLIDRRVPTSEGSGMGVGRLLAGDKAPPWCMSACWSGTGTQVLAGRRNGTIDVWDVRRGSSSTAPNLLKTLRTPAESGPISCVVAFPDGRHIASASQDNIRLWNTAEYFDSDESSIKPNRSRSRPPFKIIAGHHGGTISSMIVDSTSRFLISASGDRGWQGESTKVVLIHEVKW